MDKCLELERNRFGEWIGRLCPGWEGKESSQIASKFQHVSIRLNTILVAGFTKEKQP